MQASSTLRIRTLAVLLAALASASLLSGCNRDSSTAGTGAAPMPASPAASAASR